MELELTAVIKYSIDVLAATQNDNLLSLVANGSMELSYIYRAL